MATRPLEITEYRQILDLLLTGFTTMTGNYSRPNRQIAFALQLESNLGLRIGDVMRLQVDNFRHGKLEHIEEKTNKLQYRDINKDIFNLIIKYITDNNLSKSDKLFKISVRAVQKKLKSVVDYLGLYNIGTHSFRKLFANTIYEENGMDIFLVKEMLNHSSIATTQRYIRISQKAINKASSSINFL